MLIIFIFADNDNENSHLIKKIFEENSKNLYNFLLIKTNGNRQLSEEIFSETILTIIVNIKKIKDVKNVRSWLFVVAKNKLINQIKKIKREEKYITENSSIHISNINKDKIVNDLEKKQEKLMVKMAMNNIKEKYKKILLLKYTKEKSQKEIAEILNKSRLAVESMLNRARKALKKEINKIIKDF